MSARDRLRTLGVVSSLVTSLLGIGAGTASASAMGCPPDKGFSYGAVTASHIAAVRPSQGPSGHTLGIALTAGIAVTATLTGSISGGIGVVVANAQVQVSGSLAVSITASVTYTDSWTVPPGVRQGYLDVGAISDHMNWSHGYYNGACRWIVDSSGTLNAPYQLPAFWSWTT